MAELLLQILLEAPAYAISRLLLKFTSMAEQTAGQLAYCILLGLITAACFAAWFIYQSS
ncbi:MAG: hypothetical protein ACN6O3_14405 [Comamonas sp.]